MSITLSSDYKNEGELPKKYTHDGGESDITFKIDNVPSSAKSLAFIFYDPQAVGGEYVHWSVWNIPADTKSITTGTRSAPSGSTVGKNSNGDNGYYPPTPPAGSGVHKYTAKLYALNVEKVDLTTSRVLKSDEFRSDLARENWILEEATLVGIYDAG